MGFGVLWIGAPDVGGWGGGGHSPPRCEADRREADASSIYIYIYIPTSSGRLDGVSSSMLWCEQIGIATTHCAEIACVSQIASAEIHGPKASVVVNRFAAFRGAYAQ